MIKKGTKTMKKMRRLAGLVLAMVMVFAMSASAFAATIENNTGHTYDAYQILSGTQANGKVELGDITWGTGVNSSALLAALKEKNDYFDNCETAADVAGVLADKTNDCPEAKALAAIAVEHLTNEKTAISEEATLNAGYWLLVDTSNVDGIHDAKNAALLQVTNNGNITINKKYDVPKVEKTVNDNDANIGDTVTFTLTATMPSTFEGYETYKVVFHDTLSAGLDFVEGTVAVTVAGNNQTDKFTVSEENGTLTISCADVLTLGATASSKIVVTYNAIVDDDAVIGIEGNPNTVYLEYSNNPNWDGEGNEPTGKTPEEKVKVYTWEIPVFKYTGTNTPLAGAGFTLYKDKQCATAVNLVATEGSNIYKVCTQSGCTDHTHVTEIVTGESGKFEIEGLEKGTYYLKETTTPAGYNTCDVLTVVIGENGTLTQNGNTTTEVAILNQSGATLPETGGIGTTIFYVAGAILVIGAAVVMITRKRMDA